MRKLILLFALAWPALSAWGNGYTYRASITIDNTKVSGVDDLTNFPVLISDTYDGTGGEPDLRDTGNGGGVQSSNGWDIRFETTSGAQLDHELETYTNTTGLIVAWVEVGTVDHDDNTVIYMFYGKSGLGATEENITGTWNSAYLGVWHLNETTGQHHDATSNDNDSTTVTVTTQGTATGQVDGADTFAGASNNRVTLPNIPLTTALTDTAVEGEWHAITKDDTSEENTDTAVAVSTSWVKLRINFDSGTIKFYIDGTLKATHTTYLATSNLCPALYIKQLAEAEVKAVTVDAFYFTQTISR